ncbi:ATP-binding protein [Sorangium sp. So ce1000]|uniref:hybrid sensor histidine kinase/response regulator n=1 Tax=Sorangium sp. So ce1000 TaxID=3133325 RepID=UPI003F5E3164
MEGERAATSRGPGQRLRFGLTVKLALGVGSLLLVLAGVVAMLTFEQARRTALVALEREGDAIAETLNYTFVVLLDGGDAFHAQRIASNAAFLPGVRSVLVASLDGKVIAGSHLGSGDAIESPELLALLERGDLTGPIHERRGNELVVTSPLNRARLPSSVEGGVSGVVQVVLDTSEAETRAYAVALRMLVITVGSGVVLCVLTGILLQLIVVRPLYRLATTAERFRAGDRTQRSGIRSGDEIGVVSATFDNMAQEVEGLVAALIAARDAADAASKAKSDFLASMSHELRTPLNGVLGYAQLIELAPELTERTRDGLRIIRRSGEHLLALIDDVLDLSKIEAGKLELSPGEVRFPSFIDTVVELCRVRAEQKGLSFAYRYSGPPLALRADEKRLTQVLLNVLGNAVKFTAQGGVTFDVLVLDDGHARPPRSPRIRTVRFRVADSGPGIAPQHLSRIFERFEQVGDRTARAEGTGLGLAITKRIAEHWGGSIDVESEPGRGSVFTVTLPLEEAADGASAREAFAWEGVAGYEGERRTILVVDDNADNRALLRDTLAPLGFVVREAERGEQALLVAAEHPPSLIIMDHAMPGLDGLETTRRLREVPGLRDTVVIGSSAGVSDADRLRSIDSGCDDFLPKPVKVSALLDKLQRHLGLRWITGRAESKRPGPPDVDLGSSSRPSAEQVSSLQELLRRGRIDELLAETQRLEQAEHRLAGWLARVRALAQGYKLRELREFLRADRAAAGDEPS